MHILLHSSACATVCLHAMQGIHPGAVLYSAWHRSAHRKDASILEQMLGYETFAVKSVKYLFSMLHRAKRHITKYPGLI